MDVRKKTGKLGETAAAAFLERQGGRILERNFRSRFGEIDLIGVDGPYLAVIEVKTRRDQGSGLGAEAVDLRKQQKICSTFNYYRMKRRLTDFVPVRFDVVEVDTDSNCRWIKNAFEYMDQ